jgi:ribosome-associated translation inhibitor RaiA
MEVNFFHKNLDKKEEGVFMEYVNSKVENITALLTKFATDAVLIKASIEKFDKHDAYSVEFFVNLHGKTIVSSETSHTMRKAIDLSKDKLLVQIKKHLSSLRKDRQHKEIRKTKVDKSLVKEAIKIAQL